MTFAIFTMIMLISNGRNERLISCNNIQFIYSMLQANIDVFRGIRTANEIYEEEKRIFKVSGLLGHFGVNGKYDDWIRKNYDLLKTAKQGNPADAH